MTDPNLSVLADVVARQLHACDPDYRQNHLADCIDQLRRVYGISEIDAVAVEAEIRKRLDPRPCVD
jgi:hypothetical protein